MSPLETNFTFNFGSPKAVTSLYVNAVCLVFATQLYLMPHIELRLACVFACGAVDKTDETDERSATLC